MMTVFLNRSSLDTTQMARNEKNAETTISARMKATVAIG